MNPDGMPYLNVGQAFYNHECPSGPSDDHVRWREYQRVFGHHSCYRL